MMSKSIEKQSFTNKTIEQTNINNFNMCYLNIGKWFILKDFKVDDTTSREFYVI